MYFPSRCSYSRASSVGVLLIATTSSTSGIETRPSGRTGTVTVSSGLRQTKMFRLSPGPMRYSPEGREEAGGAGGSSGAPPHPPIDSMAAVNKAPKNVRCTFRPAQRARPERILCQANARHQNRDAQSSIHGQLLPVELCYSIEASDWQCRCRLSVR